MPKAPHSERRTLSSLDSSAGLHYLPTSRHIDLSAPQDTFNLKKKRGGGMPVIYSVSTKISLSKHTVTQYYLILLAEGQCRNFGSDRHGLKITRSVTQGK